MLSLEMITHRLSLGIQNRSAGNSCSTIISFTYALPSSTTRTIYQITVLAFLNIFYPLFMKVLIIYTSKSQAREKKSCRSCQSSNVSICSSKILMRTFGETLDYVNVKSNLFMNMAGEIMGRLYGLNLLFQSM